MLVKVLDGDKRLKQLIKEYGSIWRVKKFSKTAPWGENGCYYVESMCGEHVRWVEAEFIKET